MTKLDAPAIPGFRLAHAEVTPAFRFGETLPTEQLTERHRPRTLADMVGQGAAVWQLQSFLDAPSSRAFLFAGPTGVGKTTAARALANDLGVSADWGLLVIKSAEADGQAVDDALRMLRHSCPFGSGFKLILIDEADLMTPKAAHLWLSALEDLPPRSVVVFTTNSPDKFPDRFLDRCERIDFAADGSTLAQDAQALIDRIWRAETGRDDVPRVADLPNVTDRNNLISFRRAVSALDPLVRAIACRGPGPDEAPGTLAFAPTIAAPAPPLTAPPLPRAGTVAPVGRPPVLNRLATPPRRGKPASPIPAGSLALNLLAKRLEAELAEWDRLGAIAYESGMIETGIRNRMRVTPRAERGDLELAEVRERFAWLGRACLDCEAAIKATRAEIKRASKRK